MTVTAQSGIWGFGPQTGKTTESVYDNILVADGFQAYGQSVPYPISAGSAAVASPFQFTLTAGSCGQDVTFSIAGSAGSDPVFEYLNVPAGTQSPATFRTSNVFDVGTPVIKLEEQSASGSPQFGIKSKGTNVGQVPAGFWFKHRAVDINYGAVQDLRTFPLEVGGLITPTGAYKGGVFMAGGATIQPRLESDLGWLLKALMGDVSTSGPNPTGVYTHVFQFGNDAGSLPWLSSFKMIPGAVSGDYLVEKGVDNKVTSVRLNFPQNGILSARVDLVGREPMWTAGNNDPATANAFEEFGSVPVTCTTGGYVKVTAPGPWTAGEELPLTGLSVTMANNLTSPQQEMIIGSPYPDDFVPLSRAMSFQATLKWADAEFYNHVLRGYMSGSNWAVDSGWSNTVFTSAIDAFIESPAYIATTSTKHSIRIQAPNVMWSFQGGPVLAGGDIVMLQLIGTALAPSSNQDQYYAKITVVNGEDSYALA